MGRSALGGGVLRISSPAGQEVVRVGNAFRGGAITLSSQKGEVRDRGGGPDLRRG